MPPSLLRVPLTGPLPSPSILPASATTRAGAIEALVNFLSAPSPSHGNALVLSGAGVSVASGLADYRGSRGTYTLNKTYRPVYYNEFCQSHEARRRYWARSFLGWPNLRLAKPNSAHHAVAGLGKLGAVSSLITQNVDSLHTVADPHLPTVELHGRLRTLVCLSCRREWPREEFQKRLSELNPAWAEFLEEVIANGALSTEHPEERRERGLRTNPDGDVDLPVAPFNTFRYPACSSCLAHPPTLADGRKAVVEVDKDGAWEESSTAGALKPAVVMFGESIAKEVKEAADRYVEDASRVLVLGSSLATYSAWRLVKRAKERGVPIGILSMGGARGEDSFFADVDTAANDGSLAFRSDESAEAILPGVVDALENQWLGTSLGPSRR